MNVPPSNRKPQTNCRKLIAGSAMIVLLGLSGNAAASGGPCPGTTHTITAGRAAAAQSIEYGTSLPAGPLWNFLNGPSCAYTAVGAVTRCRPGTAYSPGVRRIASLRAEWPSTAARTQDPTGGCIFMCDGGTCTVRGADGLPVELLRFGVE